MTCVELSSEKKRPPSPPALIGKMAMGPVRWIERDGKRVMYRDWMTDPADVNTLLKWTSQKLGINYRSLEADFGEVEWDVLHGRHAGRAIADYANEEPGTFTVVTTHARQGLDRLVHGSVSADIVKHSTGAVLVHNPGPAPS